MYMHIEEKNYDGKGHWTLLSFFFFYFTHTRARNNTPGLSLRDWRKYFEISGKSAALSIRGFPLSFIAEDQEVWYK